MLAAVLLLGSSASALSLDTGASASGAVKVGGDTDVSITSETNVEAGAATETSGNTSGEAMVEVDAGPTVISASNIDANVDLSTKSSAAVQSKAQLTSYARNVVKAYADIRDVILSETEVSVSHREHARILGIFSAKVFARTTVTSDGSVTTSFPWYAFVNTKADIEAKVKTAVNSSLPSVSAGANAEAKLSAQTQAQVLEKTVGAMKSQFEADTAANVSSR